jgi:hypothetical protein
MQTIKLSKLILKVSPKLHALLTEAERDSDIVVRGDPFALNEEDINVIVAEMIAYYHQDAPYH